MGALDDFAARVGRRVKAVQVERTAAQEAVEEAMRRRRETAARIRVVAELLQGSVVWPTMETLAHQFDTMVEHLTLPAGLAAVVRRVRTTEFPARARLSIGVAWSEETGRVWLSADQAFMPVLLPLDRTTQLQVDAADPDQPAARAWVEERILAFVDACLEVERSDVYRQVEHHLDPVCGMVVAAVSDVLKLEREGRDHYFCSVTCRDRFAADPIPYLGSRPRSVDDDRGPR